MNKFRFVYSLIVLFSIALLSCEKDDTKPNNNNEDTLSKYKNGAIILNEGAFGNSNATISFLGDTATLIENDIFNAVNGRSLGDVLQHAFIADDKIFMVLNNSGKIEVANSGDFKQLSTIEGFTNPRYALVVNSKLYVTQWGGYGETGSVKVYSATDYSFIKSIPLNKGSEGIVYANNRIWVANSGGYGLDSTISVINPTTDVVDYTLNIGHNPKEMVVDKNGDIWVICSGYIEYDSNWNIARETPSVLVRIFEGSGLEQFILFQDQHPSHIDINSEGDMIFYGAGFGFNGIYNFPIDGNELSLNPIVNGYFYGFNVNPKNDDIFGLLAPNFSSAGLLNVYSSTGVLKDDFEVGIGPNTVLFN